MNESRPGVTSEVLTPEQAFEKFKLVKEKIPNLTVVGIAGPGDALANFEEVKKTVQLIREYDSEICFCLSTNGLMLPYYVDELVDIGITHLTVTINTLNSRTGSKIYSAINPEILIENQLSGLEKAVKMGMTVKVNIVAIKGINDEDIEEVVKKAKALGAYKTNIMQLIPAKGTVFENRPIMSNKELNEIRKKCSVHLKQMYHCQQCRADAIGLLTQDRSTECVVLINIAPELMNARAKMEGLYR
jgi:nitrogenase molybdenum-iron protein NifN